MYIYIYIKIYLFDLIEILLLYRIIFTLCYLHMTLLSFDASAFSLIDKLDDKL